MKKKIIEEKGSMAVYVTVVLLGFIIILSAIYMYTISVRKVQIETNIKVKESYEANYDDIDQIYEDQLAKTEPIMPEGWDSNKVKAIVSEDNVTVPVPIGYTASAIEGEKSVSTGFVIKQGPDGSLTSGINEFVWVPVNEISDIYDETNNAGQLWDLGTASVPKITYSEGSYHEPDIVTKKLNSETNQYDIDAYDLIADNLNQAGFIVTDTENDLNKDGSVTVDDFKIKLQNEFEDMIESVKKYGGFYIGRYETGNLSQSTAVVQKGNTDINLQTWYTHYKVSKTIAANTNVVTSMIWGFQWDATLRWMKNDGISDKVKNFPTDTTSTYGNYKNNSVEYVENGETKSTIEGTATKIPTGSAEITNINNIYDMAGNMNDWTIESTNIHSRTCRGGYFHGAGSSFPAYSRIQNGPTTKSSTVGSRSTLYVAL